MRLQSIVLSAFFLISVFAAVPVAAKDGVRATVHTLIPATAAEGRRIDVSLSLNDEESGEPFSACGVFVRLISRTGHATESVIRCGADTNGRYQATAIIPTDGVARIEIGIAGKMTLPDGRSERSDLIFPLANDPIKP